MKKRKELENLIQNHKFMLRQKKTLPPNPPERKYLMGDGTFDLFEFVSCSDILDLLVSKEIC